MATKLGRKESPAGHGPDDFEVMGRAAQDQGDFGNDVGVADCACVNQFGANNSKFYHGAVVRSTKTSGWFVYLEWGRIFSGKSWDGRFNGQDFQFVQCDDEADARTFFAKQMNSKNTKRLERKILGGVEVWGGRKGKDGYIVQSLATRERGLPDCYKIKDASGVQAAPKKAAPKATAKKAKAPSRSFHPNVIQFATDMVGGVRTYTKAMAAAAGVTPTMAAIKQVRDGLIPAALQRIKTVGNSVTRQCKDTDLVDISKMVSALVPRPIPRTGQSEEEAILNGSTVTLLQQDLDAFEASLTQEDFSVDTTAHATVDPDRMLNAALQHIDLNTPQGRWIANAFTRMTNNRHGYIRSGLRIKNIFAVDRPDRDAGFNAAVNRVGAKRQGRFSLKANLQSPREDLSPTEAKAFAQANVAMMIHGTRPVNIAPILGTNLRLPKSLPGAQITGANFGHGVYFATDWKKSYGYTGRGYWGHSGGDVKNRGCMMFLCDTIMGQAYRAPTTGSWNTPPQGNDSVFGVGGDRGHRLENDEHVIFDPNYQRIRYIVEFDWLN